MRSAQKLKVEQDLHKSLPRLGITPLKDVTRHPHAAELTKGNHGSIVGRAGGAGPARLWSATVLAKAQRSEFWVFLVRIPVPLMVDRLRSISYL
jgi:hypothetical protein